jgi:hypothetical protein
LPPSHDDGERYLLRKHIRPQVDQELLARHAQDAITDEAFMSSIKEQSGGSRIVLPKAFESLKIDGAYMRSIFYFYRMKVRLTVYHEVHLHLGSGLPVGELMLTIAVSAPSPEVLSN